LSEKLNIGCHTPKIPTIIIVAKPITVAGGLLSRIKGNKLDALFAEVVLGAFRPMGEDDDLLDSHDAGAPRAACITHQPFVVTSSNRIRSCRLDWKLTAASPARRAVSAVWGD